MLLILLLLLPNLGAQEVAEPQDDIKAASEEVSRDETEKQSDPASLTSGSDSGDITEMSGPSAVYAIVDLLSRSVDVLLETWMVESPPALMYLETGLDFYHVYQLQLVCAEQLNYFQLNIGIRPIPLIASMPIEYVPQDVVKLAELMIRELQMTAVEIGLENMPEQIKFFQNKTPTDVAEETLRAYRKLRALNGQLEVSPSEVYAHIVRAVADGKSILRQIDPACRYRIDAPISAEGRTARDILNSCLEARQEINDFRKGDTILPLIPVPILPESQDVTPDDVFLQVQILIAELNLIKFSTNTISSTPLPVLVSGKTPKDAHQKVFELRYIISQAPSLIKLVAEMKRLN